MLVKIHQLQGRGSFALPVQASVQGVVTGLLQDVPERAGFFLQEEDADADDDPRTSEGIFVVDPQGEAAVAVGDLVRVQGLVREWQGRAQLTLSAASGLAILQRGVAMPEAVLLSFPLPVQAASTVETATDEVNRYLEALECMRVKLPGPMVVSDLSSLSRFGQVTLVHNKRMRHPTDRALPSAQSYQQALVRRMTHQILWDDNSARQNAAIVQARGDVPVFHPQPGFSREHRLRTGDRVHDLVGVLDWGQNRAGARGSFRVRPSQEGAPVIERESPMSLEPPSVAGQIKVVSINLQNYFFTLNTQELGCGPLGDMRCRGAHSVAERERQTQKLSAALCAVSADIVALSEIENDDDRSIAALAQALRERCQSYEWVPTGILGQGVTKVGLLYRADRVRRQGEAQVLQATSFVDPTASGTPKSRPALAQRFIQIDNGQSLTLLVNHLKSKASRCSVPDDDLRLGQGNCNLTRTLAVKAQLDWLSSHIKDERVLVVGDFNAYRFEDPMRAYRDAGYQDLVARFEPDAYTYVWSGWLGNLDYALASPALAPMVQGASVWHINADESALLDYNDAVHDRAEPWFARKSASLPLFAPDARRCSDHDLIVVGLTLR